ELDAVLLDEGTGLHLVEHLEPLEHPVGLRNERLTDVEARKTLTLEQLDSIALLGEQGRNRAARRPAADHDDVCGLVAVGWSHDGVPWDRCLTCLEEWTGETPVLCWLVHRQLLAESSCGCRAS